MYKIVTKSWIKHIDFILWDLLCMEISLYLAFVARHGFVNPFNISIYRTLFILIIFVNFALTLFFNTYSDVLKRGYYQEFVKTLQMAVGMVLVITLIIFFIKETDFSRFTIGLFGIIYLLLSYGVRIIWKKFVIKINRSKGAKGRAILIIASRDNMEELINGITDNGTNGYFVAGLVCTDDDIEENTITQETILEVPVVATLDTLSDYAKVHWVDEAIAMLGDGDMRVREKLQTLSTMGITVHTCINQKDTLQGTRQTYSIIGKVPAMTYSINFMTPLQSIGKRLMDLILGLIGTIVMGLAFLVIAPIILIQDPGPIFFVQKRVGRNGKIFNFYKFRSMYTDAEERKKDLMAQNEVKDGLMFKMEFDPRVIGNRIDENGNKKTGLGNFIRKYSIDELPQFINVLKGDMSVVGTRPPTVQEYEKYEAHHKVRLAIKPGLTGMWQVSGRSNIKDFEEVVRLDTEYINTWSIGLDFKIIFKTFKVVIKHEGSM